MLRTHGLAFLIRSLRQESRLTSHHLLRAGLAGFVLMNMSAYFAQVSQRTGAGAAFASSILFVCYFFLTLLGGIYFASCITEEKEEQTLPLLRMTGAGPWTILIGKSVPRLMVAVLLLLVAMPFLVLSVTLGGVLIRGLLLSTLGLLTYAVMLSQMGTLVSVVFQRTSGAFRALIILWLAVEWPTWTWVLDGIVAAFRPGRPGAVDELQALRDWLSERSLMFNLSSYVTSWSEGPLWTSQMTFHLVLAAVFLVLSRLLFERFTVAAQAGAEAGALRRRRLRFRKTVSRSRGRVSEKALAWKTFRYVAGGRRIPFVLAVALPLLVAATAAGGIYLSGPVSVRSQEVMEMIAGVMITAGIPVAFITACRMLGQVFSVEVRDRTLPGLLMLPLSRWALILQMLTGLIPALLASTVCTVAGFVLGMVVNVDDSLKMIGDAVTEPFVLHLVTWPAATLSLGLVLSLRMRHAPMLTACIIGFGIAPMVVMSCLVLAAGPFIRSSEDGFVMLLILGECFFCFLMWSMLPRELDRIAGRD